MMDSAVPISFEEALADLDQVVRDLEDGQIGLEAALTRYEKGVGLLKHCYGLLHTVEQRILVLTGVDGDGRPITQPFEPALGDGDGKPKPSGDGAIKVSKKTSAAESRSEPAWFDQ